LIFISVVLASQHSSATPNRENASVSASTAIEKTVCRCLFTVDFFRPIQTCD
jgi:hypothetical protein